MLKYTVAARQAVTGRPAPSTIRVQNQIPNLIILVTFQNMILYTIVLALLLHVCIII